MKLTSTLAFALLVSPMLAQASANCQHSQSWQCHRQPLPVGVSGSEAHAVLPPVTAVTGTTTPALGSVPATATPIVLKPLPPSTITGFGKVPLPQVTPGTSFTGTGALPPHQQAPTPIPQAVPHPLLPAQQTPMLVPPLPPHQQAPTPIPQAVPHPLLPAQQTPMLVPPLPPHQQAPTPIPQAVPHPLLPAQQTPMLVPPLPPHQQAPIGLIPLPQKSQPIIVIGSGAGVGTAPHGTATAPSDAQAGAPAPTHLIDVRDLLQPRPITSGHHPEHVPYSLEFIEPGIQNHKVAVYRSKDVRQVIYQDINPMDAGGFHLRVIGIRKPEYSH